MKKIFDVSNIPLGDFTLRELIQRHLALKYTPNVMYVTEAQHIKVLSSHAPETGLVLWKTWRGIPIEHRGKDDLPDL